MLTSQSQENGCLPYANEVPLSVCEPPSAHFLACRVSTGSIRFQMAELVDLAGCSQDVRGRSLFSPLHYQDNLPAMPPRTFHVRILTHPDSRGRRRLHREERRLAHRRHHSRHLPPAHSHTLRPVQLRLRHPLSLVLIPLVRPIRALYPVLVATPIRSPTRHLPLRNRRLYLPLMSFWQ
jgi:hypothetical protein